MTPMHCPACNASVQATIGTVEGATSFDRSLGPVASPLGARFAYKCPRCEQVLGAAQQGDGETVSIAGNYDHLPAEKRQFSQPHSAPPPPVDITRGQPVAAADLRNSVREGIADVLRDPPSAAPALATATGEQITKRARARLEALEAIVPGLTAERAMLRRMLRAAEARRGKAAPSNVVPISREPQTKP
jgi:copper chaperone CopZ